VEDKDKLLYNIHNNIWDEEVLTVFEYTIENVLAVRLKQLVELKVEGYPDSDICKLLDISRTTLRKNTETALEILRLGSNPRADNLLSPRGLPSYLARLKRMDRNRRLQSRIQQTCEEEAFGLGSDSTESQNYLPIEEEPEESKDSHQEEERERRE